jgi:purine-cytosine permease-like protein
MSINSSVLTRIIYAVVIICAGLLLIDFFYHRHGHFVFEEWFGFYAFFGFLAYAFIALVSKQLGKILKRSEDYYD